MTALDTHSPVHRKCLSLPFELWPEADRKAWTAACQPGARLKRGGAAGHLRPDSRAVHERHYGNFLGFLDRNGLLRQDAPAAANVTPENVVTYLAEAKACMTSTMLRAPIRHLRKLGTILLICWMIRDVPKRLSNVCARPWRWRPTTLMQCSI